MSRIAVLLHRKQKLASLRQHLPFLSHFSPFFLLSSDRKGLTVTFSRDRTIKETNLSVLEGVSLYTSSSSSIFSMFYVISADPPSAVPFPAVFFLLFLDGPFKRSLASWSKYKEPLLRPRSSATNFPKRIVRLEISN